MTYVSYITLDSASVNLPGVSSAGNIGSCDVNPDFNADLLKPATQTKSR
jgi:hypothetical protein